MVSEAFLGSKLGLPRAPVDDIEEEDELEVALAQQRAEKAKTEGKGDAGDEESDKVEEEPTTPTRSALRKPIGRAASRLQVRFAHSCSDSADCVGQ